MTASLREHVQRQAYVIATVNTDAEHAKVTTVKTFATNMYRWNAAGTRTLHTYAIRVLTRNCAIRPSMYTVLNMQMQLQPEDALNAGSESD